VIGVVGGPVRFTARLSNSVPWTVTVRDPTGATVATGSGTGTRVDWTWDATAAPVQRYTWAITAPQMRAATGALGNAPAPLALQQLRVSPSVVSPNGDGRGDQATFAFRLSTAASVTATVQDTVGATIATVFRGTRSSGKQQLKWDPAAIPDGWYKLLLVASSAGKQVQVSTHFWVDRTLGGTALTSRAFSPNGDGRSDTVSLRFTLVNPAHVVVRVLRASAVVATLLDQNLLAGPQQLTVNGNGLADGRYLVSVTATDTLRDVTQTVPVTIDRRPPSLRLVSFSRLLFRTSEPGTLVLGLNGRWRKYKLRRAGLAHIAHRGTVRGLTAYVVDAAGNRSRAVTARR
jgi:hypothetical protein